MGWGGEKMTFAVTASSNSRGEGEGVGWGGGGWQGRLRTMCRRAPSRAERLIVAHALFWCNPKSRKECLGKRTS